MDFYQEMNDICLDYFKRDEVKNAWELAEELMDIEGLPMHCPPHHFLMPAVLLTVLGKQQGISEEQLQKQLKEACKRSKNVLGGFCGFYGSCGAAVGTGIFMSVYTKSSPGSGQTWSWCNETTGRALLKIASVEGPKCCKRNTYLALESVHESIREHLGEELAQPERVVCKYYPQNKECKREKCPYYSGN